MGALVLHWKSACISRVSVNTRLAYKETRLVRPANVALSIHVMRLNCRSLCNYANESIHVSSGGLT